MTAVDVKHWLPLADRVREGGDYTHADLARGLVDQLGWTRALDVATALRSYVYGQPGGSELHKDVEPLYRRLGWEQSALVACWFRDACNRPDPRPKKRAGGWPTTPPRTEETPVTSHVEQRVQARIEQARAKVQAAQRQRDELSAARRRGIAARHANKLRHLAEAEQRAAERQDDEPDGQDHDGPARFR